MQMHPDESQEAIKHAVETLSAGYVGLDFASDVPDLASATAESLPENQKHYLAFAPEMSIGD